MKTNIFKLFIAIAMAITIASCKKEEKLNVDLKNYNTDDPVTNSALDAWLKSNFLDEYNIDVIYRYNRFYHGDDRDIATVNTDKVQPQMQSILDGFILPYRKIAGVAFIKKMIFKQFVLFGSGSYESNGTYIAGTASGGIRVTLYDVNNFDPNNADSQIGKIGIMHHEFTHVLNQIVPRPDDFQNITKSTYNATWTTVADATARDNGYVSNYASASPTEDFAETTRALLVNGEAWFDFRANTATAAGKAALKAKEASIVQYFNVNLGVDFRKLQQEVQNVIRNNFKWQNASFPYWFGQNLFKTMTVNLESNVYTDNGIASDFANAYNQFKAAMLAYSSTYKYHMDYLQLRFETATTLTVRVAFTSPVLTPQYFADYSFTYTVNSTTGAVTFTKVTNATGTTFTNGNAYTAAFASSIQAYLTGKTFTASWIPATINSDNFNSYAGFSVSGTPTSYFYGQLGETLQ